jgi:hypothetical protein
MAAAVRPGAAKIVAERKPRRIKRPARLRGLERLPDRGHIRWRYAKVDALNHGAIWNADIRLSACGDWLLGPRIEAAWLSGQQLAALVGSPNWTVFEQNF